MNAMTPVPETPSSRAADTRLALESAAGRAAFLNAFSRAFVSRFSRAFKSAAIAGALGSFALLRIVTQARPVSSPKLDTLTELGVALAGAFVAVVLLRVVEALYRREHTRRPR